jgi:hypothetical protein
MTRRRKWIAVAAAALTAITAVTATGLITNANAAVEPDEDLPDVCENPPPPNKVPIAAAKLIIEFNSTDDDLGVHGLFEDDGWSELCVFDPRGRPIAAFDPHGSLNDLAMGGVFFESREPPADEFSMADLAAAFPEGKYKVRAKSFDGKVLVGQATFTHDVPAPPTITAPKLAEDPEQPGTPVSRSGLVVDWNRVTKTVDGAPLTPTGYEVIVTKEDHDDPHGFSQPIYDVHVPPTVTALSVPRAFLQPDTVYEVEVLALETSGNQTITVGFFVTA